VLGGRSVSVSRDVCLRTKVAGNRGQRKDRKGHKIFSPFNLRFVKSG
jgi:hypothetical protein